jgi:hypothetical protein
LIDSINQQVAGKLDLPSADHPVETGLPFEPIAPLSNNDMSYDTNQSILPSEQGAFGLEEQESLQQIPTQQTISARQAPLDSATPADHKISKAAHQQAPLPSDQNMTVDAVFRQIMHEKTAELEAAVSEHDVHAAEGTDTNYRTSALIHDDTNMTKQKMPEKIFDKAFEEMAYDEQIARKPRKKSLAMPMLLGALVLCLAIAFAVYFLDYGSLFPPQQKAPAKALPKSAPVTQAPTLETAQAPQAPMKPASDTTTLTAMHVQAPPEPAPQPESPADAHMPSPATGSQPIATPPAAVPHKPVIPTEQPRLPQEPQITEQKQAAEKPVREAAAPSEAAIEPPSHKEVATLKSPATGYAGDYMLLAGSYKIEQKAVAEAARLRTKGYNAIIEKVNLGAKGIWHRVEIIGFESREAAENAGAALKQKEKVDSIVTKRK